MVNARQLGELTAETEILLKTLPPENPLRSFIEEVSGFLRELGKELGEEEREAANLSYFIARIGYVKDEKEASTLLQQVHKAGFLRLATREEIELGRKDKKKWASPPIFFGNEVLLATNPNDKRVYAFIMHLRRKLSELRKGDKIDKLLSSLNLSNTTDEPSSH